MSGGLYALPTHRPLHGSNDHRDDHRDDGTPAHDVDAERSVLGAMMLDARAITDVLPALGALDFHQPAHELVFDAITALHSQGRPVDAVTVSAELTRRGDLARVGGAPYLHTLIASVPTTANAGYYAAIVADRAVLRRLTAAGTRIAQLGHARTGGDVADLTAAARAELASALHAAQASGSSWEPIAPLTTKRLLPGFPVQVLPEWTRHMVAEVTEALQVPVDLPGGLALAALSVACGGRVDVSPLPGWVEPTNLYMVTALPPGSRKSATFSAMTRPLYDAEAALAQATAPARIEAQLVARRARAQADRAAKVAETADGNPDAALAEAIAAAEDAAAHTEHPEPRLLADDLTPETASTLLHEHGGRLALLSAEGGAFATVTGTRYSASPNMEPLLKAHAGDMIRVDRTGRGHERVDRPALTIGITTQPENLAEIAANPAARDRGLLARFLFCTPANTVGHRDIGTAPVTDATKATYAQRLTRLVLDLAAMPDRADLSLTADALSVLRDLEVWLEPRLHPDHGALASVTDWASKMAGVALRLAGLLHMAQRGPAGLQHPISGVTMSAAVDLARYYLAHALAVFDVIGHTPDQDGARRVLAWIERTRPQVFTRRELHRALTSRRFPTAAWLDGPLAVLVEHGHIRPAPRPTRARGRPRPPNPTPPDPHPPPSAAFVSSVRRRSRPTRQNAPPLTCRNPFLSVLSVLSGHPRRTVRSAPAEAARKHLTIPDVCAELGVARSTFYDWRAKGAAPRCMKLPNGELRIRRADLDDWLTTLEAA